MALQASIQKIHLRGAQETGHEFVDRSFVEFLRATFLLNMTIMHHDDSIGEGHGLDLVVGHINHVLFHTLAHQCEFGPHLTPQFGV